jgi:hypothetical protein
MADRLGTPGIGVSIPAWVALLIMFCHGAAHSALPSSEKEMPGREGGARAQKGSASVPEAASIDTADSQEIQWVLPPVRFGGSLSHTARQNSSEEQKTGQTGQTVTLSASTNTYIWKPWFAQINGQLGVSKSTDSSSTTSLGSDALNGSSSSSRAAFVTGAAQLSILPQSAFPFEAHLDSSDSRVTADTVNPNRTRGLRYGFTQRFSKVLGDAALAWDRNTQTDAENGRDIQDALQLTLSHSLESHRLNFFATHNVTTRETTGEQTGQDNITLQHSFSPDTSFSVDNMVNASRFGAELQNGSSNTRLLQLNSNAFWRPEDEPYSFNAGVRAFVIESESRAFNLQNAALGPSAFESRVFNANGGLNYEFNPETRLYGSINANFVENAMGNATATTQTVGASYQPSQIKLGAFQYGWGASANASNQTGGENGGAQLLLQLSHSLSRSTSLESGATLGISLSQGLSTVDTLSVGDGKTPPPNSQQITHNASLSWSAAHEGGAAMVQVSASDSRTLDGRPEFFQLINVQASSSLSADDFSSWSGSLTMQATRQNEPSVSGSSGLTNASGNGFSITSGGSISYQNQRAFNVRRLRFVSDLQLNSQALLPLLDNGLGQEMSAWNNRLMYSIGRTQLQVGLQLSNSSTPRRSIDPVTKVETIERAARRNQSIMFSVSRNFGDL